MAKKHGVSNQTIYSWWKRFGTMKASDTKRLRALEIDERIVLIGWRVVCRRRRKRHTFRR